MVRLNVIYTRTGDGGETGLGDGSRRPKTDARVVAMGDVDEANCAVGLARLSTGGAADPTLAAIEPTLARIQNDLFDLGADLCLPRRPDEAPGAALRVAPSQVEALERAIDALNEKLEPLRSFVLPGGTAAAAALHQARAVCRRAERSVVALAAIEGETVGAAALAYVNRLSDYLFVAARAANDDGRADVLWVPGASQSEAADERGGPCAAIGVISGTSMDGIDVALIVSDGEARVETGPAATFPYPEPIALALRAVVADPSEAEKPQAELERAVTDAHVAAVEAFLDRFGVAATASRLSACTARPFCIDRARGSRASSATEGAPPLCSESTSFATSAPPMSRPAAKARRSRRSIMRRWRRALSVR